MSYVQLHHIESRKYNALNFFLSKSYCKPKTLPSIVYPIHVLPHSLSKLSLIVTLGSSPQRTIPSRTVV